jgi:hypothetical protein
MRPRVYSTLLSVLVVLSIASSAVGATQSTLIYDHSTRKWQCGSGLPQISPCVMSVYEGDVITVSIINTLPGLFSYEIKKTDREPEGLSNALAEKLGIPVDQKSGGTGGGVGPNGLALLPTTEQLYQDVLRSLRELKIAVVKEGFPGYADKIRALRAAHDALITDLRTNKHLAPGANSATEVLAALKAAGVTPSLTDDAFVEFWGHLQDLLADAPDAVAPDGPSGTFTYEDRDFDIEIIIKATNPLLSNPDIDTTSAIRLTHAFRVTTTTGFAISGLVDKHYTVVTETVGTGDDAHEVRKAVEEERDKISIPEATLFVHLAPAGGGKWSRAAISVGIGIANDASGRLYAGVSWRIGSAGAFTIGMAGGKVKHLSRNVDVDNLGEVDPEQSRRDVYRSSYMVGISWRLTGK